MGVGPSTAVSWQLPTRIETIVLSMALARLGVVQNPIIHIYREREVAFALAQTGAEFFFVPGVWKGFDYVAMADKIGAGLQRPPTVVVAYDSLPEGDPATLPAPPPPGGDEVRWIYYTSGTTSDPKGVRHTDTTLVTGGRGLAMAVELSEHDVGSIAFPFAHIAGPDYLVMVLAIGFSTGAARVVRARGRRWRCSPAMGSPWPGAARPSTWRTSTSSASSRARRSSPRCAS